MTTDGYSFEAHIKELQQRLATAEAERDRLTDRIKELEDALAAAKEGGDGRSVY